MLIMVTNYGRNIFFKYEVHHICMSGKKRKWSQHVLVTLLSFFLILPCLILTTSLWSINYLYFINLKIRAQRNIIIHSLSILIPKKNMLFLPDLEGNNSELWIPFHNIFFHGITYVTLSSALRDHQCLP